jgi:hypothetical protein
MCGPVAIHHHRRVRKRRKGSVPWVTHVVGAVLFVAWLLGGTAGAYGIDWRDTQWWPWADTDPFILTILAFLCLVLAPAVAFVEAGLARLASGWPARVLALCYVAVIGWFAGIPFAFRLVGDDSPGDGSDAVMFLQAFVLLVSVQLAAALGAARLLASPRLYPAAAGVRGRTAEGRPLPGPPEALAAPLRTAHARLYGPRARHPEARPGDDAPRTTP